MASEEKKQESESSGLSDILELAASLGSDNDEDSGPNAITRSADEDRDEIAVGSGYGGVAGAALVAGEGVEVPAPPAAPKPTPPVVTPTPPRAAKPRPAPAASAISTAPAPVVTQRRKGGAMWMILVAVVALIGIGWFVMQSSGDPPKKSAKAPAVATQPKPAPEPAKVAEAVPPPAPEPVPVVVEEGATDGTGEPVEVIEEGESDSPVAEVTASARAGRKRTKNGGDKPAPKVKETPAPEETPEEPPPAAPEPKSDAPPPADDGKFSSECLLNPSKPGCAELRRRQELGKKDLDKTLSEKLSQTDIRSAVSPLKNRAKACGPKFSIEPGTTVRIKLSIEGATGNVLSAQATAPHDGAPVGKCVSDVFVGAKFPRFKKQQQGIVYPLRM